MWTQYPEKRAARASAAIKEKEGAKAIKVYAGCKIGE